MFSPAPREIPVEYENEYKRKINEKLISSVIMILHNIIYQINEIP